MKGNRKDSINGLATKNWIVIVHSVSFSYSKCQPRRVRKPEGIVMVAAAQGLEIAFADLQ